MARDKKLKGDRPTEQKPVDEHKAKIAGQNISGHPDSEGGSRQGNIGHEKSGEAGRGDTQA